METTLNYFEDQPRTPCRHFNIKFDKIKTMIEAKKALAVFGLFGATVVGSVEIAHCTIEQTPPENRKYRNEPPIFDLQTRMKEDYQIGKCEYYDPWEFWGRVIINTHGQPELTMCPPQDNPTLFWTIKER